MMRPLRPLLLCLVALLALASSGCGQRMDLHTIGETEGMYLNVGDLRYQVQISRYINAADVEDEAYLMGLEENVELPDDETWFGVFMRVSNETEEPHQTAGRFEIHTTQERVFRPVPLDPDSNPFVYEQRMLDGREILPDPDSVAGSGPIRGELLLFRIDYESLQNRPLELRIYSPDNPEQYALVDLDV